MRGGMGLQILSGFGIGKFAFQASDLSSFQIENDTSKGLAFVWKFGQHITVNWSLLVSTSIEPSKPSLLTFFCHSNQVVGHWLHFRSGNWQSNVARRASHPRGLFAVCFASVFNGGHFSSKTVLNTALWILCVCFLSLQTVLNSATHLFECVAPQKQEWMKCEKIKWKMAPMLWMAS